MGNAENQSPGLRERVARGISVLQDDVVEPLEAFLEGLPVTAWCLIIGLLFVAFGFALETRDLMIEAGLSGAMAVFFIGVAVLGQLVIWSIGIADRERTVLDDVREFVR